MEFDMGIKNDILSGNQPSTSSDIFDFLKNFDGSSKDNSTSNSFNPLSGA